jgi:hypothetical protein
MLKPPFSAAVGSTNERRVPLHGIFEAALGAFQKK